MPLSPAKINVLSLFCETLLYGIYAELMAVVLYICCTSRTVSRSLAGLYAVTFVMFILATCHEGILLSEQLGGTITMQQTQGAVAAAQLMIAFGDAILIWRVWVVWNRNYLLIVVPALSTIAALAVGLLSAATIASHNSLKQLLPLPTLALGLVNTILCTGLIAGRLLYLEWKLNSALGLKVYGVHSYRRIVLLLVESGALLVSMNIVSLVLMEIENPGLHVILNISAQLMGIVPTTIIVLAQFDLMLGSHLTQRAASTTVLSDFEARAGAEPKSTDRGTTSVDPSTFSTNIIHVSIQSDSADYKSVNETV